MLSRKAAQGKGCGLMGGLVCGWVCRLIKEKENVFKINFCLPLRVCFVLLPFYSLRFACLQLINTKPAMKAVGVQGRRAFSGRLCCLGQSAISLLTAWKCKWAQSRWRTQHSAAHSSSEDIRFLSIQRIILLTLPIGGGGSAWGVAPAAKYA